MEEEQSFCRPVHGAAGRDGEGAASEGVVVKNSLPYGPPCARINVVYPQEVLTVEILKVVLMIIFAIDCIALTIIILMQEGKQAGLGTIGGMADTYWGQNKGRSMEGALVKSTKFLAILFIVLAAVLNLQVFA